MRRPAAFPVACVVGAAVGALAITSCGTPGPTPLRAPPVAASAPPLTVAPAGRVLQLRANRPEGIAASDSDIVLDTQASQLEVLTDAGKQVRLVTLPGSGRHVRVTGGDALIPLEGVGELAVVDIGPGTAQTIAVGRAPHDAVALPGRRALVGNEADGDVSVVNLATLRQTETLPAGLQPGGLAADGDFAAAVDVRGRYLYRYRVGATVTSAGRVAVGAGPTHVVDLGGGLVAVADALGDAVDEVSLPTLRIVAHIPLVGAPEGLAADPARGVLWVTLPGLNQLVEISGSSVARTYATVRQANSVAVAPNGEVVVAGATAAGTLQILQPSSPGAPLVPVVTRRPRAVS